MTPVNHTPQGFDVALGIVFAVLGAYALFSGEAGLPSALGLLTTKRKDHPVRYWLVVVLLFLFAVISLVRAWTSII